MIKKISLPVILLFLTGCHLFSKDQEPSPATSQESTTTTVLVDQSTDRTFLNEKLDEKADYPELTLPENAPQDLNQAIQVYYQEKFTQTQKENSQKPLTQSQLKALKKSLNTEEELKELDLAVDQSQLKIGSDTLYVPRLIVPMRYSQAEKKCQDNDTKMINAALSELGNRLLIVAYYDEAEQILRPMHLVNSTESLYFDDAQAKDQ